MKIFLPVLIILGLSFCCTSYLYGQVTITWTGANSTTDWYDSGNWNPMAVPDSLDMVIISDTAITMPILLGDARVRSVVIQPTASLTIDTLAKLVIQNNAGSGLLPAGTLTNHGRLEISASNQGIAPTSGVGQLNNYGYLEIHSIHQEAIRYHTLFNYYNASIIVRSDSSHGIVLTSGLLNRGNILVTNAAETGLLTSGTNVVNACPGRIDISNCKLGMLCRKNFSNVAHIYIKNSKAGIVHEQIGGIGTFINQDENVIYMQGILDTALIADHFINDGYLEIQGQPQSFGIVVEEDQLFINQTSGQINLSGDLSSSLQVDSSGDFYITNFSERDYQPDELNWDYNRNEYQREIDSVVRNFLVHVPEIYDSTTAVPLLFMFHGSSGTGTKFYNISKWVEKANVENFIAVFPTGMKYYLTEDGHCSTKWSSNGVNQQVIDSTKIIDDVPFIRELIALCQNTFNIDTSRIYACGFSNGGAFVRTRLLDEMAGEWSALAASGGFGFRSVQPVPDSIYLPFYDLIGSLDDRALESNGVSPEFPYTADSLFAIPTVYEKIVNTTITLQVDTTYMEDSYLPSYNVIQFHDDLSGQGNEYNFAMVPGLGHMFANGDNHPVVYVNILWPWFMQWTR